jgi:hypothetical protein
MLKSGDNMKKKILISVLALELIFTGVVFFYINFTPVQANTDAVVVKGLEKSEFYPAFKEIKNIPYSNDLNCKNKSELFAEFVYSHGYRNIKILQVWNRDYSKGHQVVLIDGFVYDPTCGFYQIKKAEFLEISQKNGLNGPVITQDYVHNNSMELCKLIAGDEAK